MGRGEVPGLRGRVELLKALVHELEGEADGHGGDDDADEEGESLQAGRGANQEAGLEVLRGIASLARGDADHATNGDGESTEGRGGPAVDEEDSRGGHEGGDGHAGDGVGGGADEAHDARTDGDEEETEEDDQHRCGQIGPYTDLCSGDGFEV